MADKIPLRVVYVSGTPQIGEFQSGDTVGVTTGGTGTSSLTQFREDLGINDLMLSSMDDVQPLIAPSVGNSLVWTGSVWDASAITGGGGGGGGGVTDHGALTGLSDNDHPQYTLSSTNNALSSLVTSIETSTVALSSYISGNEASWVSATPASSIDHGLLTGLADNDHPQYTLSSTYSAHVTDGSKHFTVGSIDHGLITGLADDDHTQYLLVDGSRTATGNINFDDTNAQGKFGNILSNNFGLSSGDPYLVNAGTSLYFSATSNYVFNKAGTTKSISDFPQFLTDTEAVIADKATGYYQSFIQLIDSAGGSETNAASKSYITFGTIDTSGGAATTDYTVSGGGDGVVINTAGTYEISFDIGVTGTGGSQRTGSVLRCEVDGVDVGPTSKTGYIRISTGHDNVSYNLATFVREFTSGQVLKIGATRETTATGSVLTLAGESYLYIRRIL